MQQDERHLETNFKPLDHLIVLSFFSLFFLFPCDTLANYSPRKEFTIKITRNNVCPRCALTGWSIFENARSCGHGSVPRVTEHREASSSVVLYRGVVPNWRLPSVEDRLYTAVCVPRCSMNAALKASTFVCHLTTPRFRSRLLPVLAFAILPPPFFCFSSFIPFFLSFFFYPFFSVFLLLSLSFCLSSFFESFSLSLSLSLFIGTQRRAKWNGSRRQRKSANYLSGMEFWELDSRSFFLKAYM